MSSVDQAYETQLKNIQARTGKTLPELEALIQSSGLTKHSEIRSMLIRELGLGYGDANTLVHFVMKSDGTTAAREKSLSSDAVLDEIYSGAKAQLRPIHERLMQAINTFGEFEIAPKKGYVSLRRKRQFAMIGPATNSRIEVGINYKNFDPNERLVEQPAGSMCNVKVRLTDSSHVDDELVSWIKIAFDHAG